MPNFHHFSLFIGDTPLRGGAAAHRSVVFLSGSLSWALDFKKTWRGMQNNSQLILDLDRFSTVCQ